MEDHKDPKWEQQTQSIYDNLAKKYSDAKINYHDDCGGPQIDVLFPVDLAILISFNNRKSAFIVSTSQARAELRVFDHFSESVSDVQMDDVVNTVDTLLESYKCRLLRERKERIEIMTESKIWSYEEAERHENTYFCLDP